jgi:hypothetical protein
MLADPTLSKIFSTSYTLDALHANKDYEEVRLSTYEFIKTLDIKVDVIVVEKLKTRKPLQADPGRMYGTMAGQLLRDQLHQTETEVIFSRKDSKLKLQNELTLAVDEQRRKYLKSHPNLGDNVSLTYYHNPHYTHGGLQIADYIAHAVYKVFEQGDRRFYDIIAPKIGRIHDICNLKFYTKRNPL